MVKEGMASGIVIIWINYRRALINETEVLSDLDQIQFFLFSLRAPFFLKKKKKKIQAQFSEACFFLIMCHLLPFDCNISSY